MKYPLFSVVALVAGGFAAVGLRGHASPPRAVLAAQEIVDIQLDISVESSARVTTPLPISTALSPTSTPAPSPTSIASPPPWFEPAGCRKPADDYDRIQVNGWWLNQRTYGMLQYAKELYSGPIDITGRAIARGSYVDSDQSSMSQGSHLGGGALDLAVTLPGGTRPLFTEIEPLIRALRVAGFAAWLYDESEVFLGPGLHIHALAIGDAELSPQAVEQVSGPMGYFAGYSGMLDPGGAPMPDHHGGPIVCQWMQDAGYAKQSTFRADLQVPIPWNLRLKQAAQAYVVGSVAESYEVAYRLDWLPGLREDPSLMCGPLAAAILRDAGLLPAGIGPVQHPEKFWLADPIQNGRPWQFFSTRDYELFRYDTPIEKFDYAAWPLLPADLVYTYQGRSGYEHLFVVTEVDALGRAYTVTNNRQADGSFIVQRVLLYDPRDPTLGALKHDWAKRGHDGRTGLLGFDVLRRKGATLPAGSLYEYVVEPGDTLPIIVARFSTSPDSILAENHLPEPYGLTVGQPLVLQVNIGLLAALPPTANAADAGASSAPRPLIRLPDWVTELAAVSLWEETSTARLRDEPNGRVIAALEDGTPVRLLDGRVEVDGVLWRQVRLGDGGIGWIAESLLKITHARQ